eukprot:SAG31_NODE_12397_length_945_cov_0.691489_1_plen_249_part_10
MVAVLDFERPPVPLPEAESIGASTAWDSAVSCEPSDNREQGANLFNWRWRFDLIFSFNTFHHLLDPFGAVATAYSLLAPSGIVYLQGVPIDTLLLSSKSSFSDGAGDGKCDGGGQRDGKIASAQEESSQSDQDIVVLKTLCASICDTAGSRACAFVDPVSVARQWVRRGRALWVQQRLAPHTDVENGWHWLRYCDAMQGQGPVVRRHGCDRVLYSMDAGAKSSGILQPDSRLQLASISAVVAEWMADSC